MSKISKEINLCINVEVDSWRYNFLKETTLAPESIKKNSKHGFIDPKINLKGKSAYPYHCLPEEYLETIGFQDFDSKNLPGLDRRLNFPRFVNARNLSSSLDYLNIIPSDLEVLNFEQIYISRSPPFSRQPKFTPFEYESVLSITASFSNLIKKFDFRFNSFSIDERNRILWQDISDAAKNNPDRKGKLLQERPAIIGNIKASACISTVSIRLSEHHEKKICDAIETFPKNRIILEFEGYWTETSHTEQSGEFNFKGKANLKPSAISITVLSDKISS